MNKGEKNNLLIQDLESLIKEIKGKMNDLKIPITDENAVGEAIEFLDLQPLYHQADDQSQHGEVQGSLEPGPQPVLVSKKKDNTLPHNHGKAGDSGNSSGMEDILDNSRRSDQAKVADHSGEDGKSHTSLNGFKKGNEKFPSSTANDLFFAVFKGDSKHASSLLNQYKEDPAIFQSGFWMQTLLISDEEALELAKKDNKNIIKEIQERQAKGICSIGFVMAVSAIIAIAAIILTASIPMTPGVITGIVAAGILGFTGLLCVSFAFDHEPKKVPSAAMDGVHNIQHAPEPEQKTAFGGISS